jgi:long-chain acyl-CoA synthetase
MTPRPWVFDVDGCLVDSLTGTSLRPGAADLLAALSSAGHPVHVWSAGGARYARQRLVDFGLASLVSGWHAKSSRDSAGRYASPLTAADDAVFVDDRPEDLPTSAVVIAVSPYIAPNPHDRALTTLDPRRLPETATALPCPTGISS